MLSGDRSGANAIRLELFGPDGRLVARHETTLANALEGDRLQLEIPLRDAPRWSPETPILHRAELTLLQDGLLIDRVDTRFGVRTIEIRGHEFIVNGVKYFINGYGDDAVFVDTIAPPSDKQFYLDRLKVAKSYGFNFVRHHSHFMPPEYYEACDEIGMFVSPELPIAYPRYYDRAKGRALDLYRQEWAGAIVRYRNHPSIFNWCMGNELWEGIAIGPELYAMAKELDPTRAVLDSDGIFPPGFIDGTKDRPTKDYLTVMFDILTTPLENPRKFDTGVPLKPIVTHEEGNFAFFPKLDEVPLYENTPFKPFWLTSTRDRVAR
ncbi:MAG TPA: glycoside hydrolase family 2 TIM barrel-domain containing protein, partial [Opitutus sp.]|nr:glycoside hydrolase family 2 TIM barrel-domain containing protein [Opitutus sp.]